MRIAGYEYDGAVMITASHLPYNRNGFKFFTRDGGYEKADIAQLLKLAAAEHAAAEAPNLDPAAAYLDDAFVLSCALHSSPALIEYVRSPSPPLSVLPGGWIAEGQLPETHTRAAIISCPCLQS